MATPLMELPWEGCLLVPLRDKELTAWLKREVGLAPGWALYVGSSRWFAKAMIRFQYDKRLVPALEDDLAMQVLLAVSRENSCRYCYAMLRMMLRLFGLDETSMQGLERHLADARDLPPRTLAAVRFARIVNRGSPLDGARERQALTEAGFGAEEIRQLAFLVGGIGMMNRMTTSVALAPQFLETMSSHWSLGLLHPIVSRLFRYTPKAILPAAGSHKGEPMFPALLAVYAGSPIADLLGSSFADMWHADTISLREKLLIIATITQGVACEACRGEVARVATANGIDVESLYDSVAHLDNANLDERERAMLEFARESLWYEPQKLQRRAQALHRAVGTPEFVEILGVTIVANMLTRLSATLVDAV